MKKTKPRKSKKGGGDDDLSWAIIIGSGGNLSPKIQRQLTTKRLTKSDSDIIGLMILMRS